MSAPRVSIVIPTFNRANLLPRAIDSALAQTYTCEVVVCDHGSTDATPSVAKSYGDRIKYIRRESDRGPITCWRDGIENATGEFIHINYDDDWISPNFVEKTAALLRPDVGFVYTRVQLHFLGTSSTGTLLFHPAGVRPIREIVQFLLRYRLTISPGCALFRKSDLLKNLLIEIPGAGGVYGKNSGVGEDLLLFLLTSLDYPKYAHVPETLSHFLAHPKSITISAKLNGKNRALVTAYSKAKEHYLSKNGSIPISQGISKWIEMWRWWRDSGFLNYIVSFAEAVQRKIRLLCFR